MLSGRCLTVGISASQECAPGHGAWQVAAQHDVIRGADSMKRVVGPAPGRTHS
jgi:hypothetical protein